VTRFLFWFIFDLLLLLFLSRSASCWLDASLLRPLFPLPLREKAGREKTPSSLLTPKKKKWLSQTRRYISTHIHQRKRGSHYPYARRHTHSHSCSCSSPGSYACTESDLTRKEKKRGRKGYKRHRIYSNILSPSSPPFLPPLTPPLSSAHTFLSLSLSHLST